MSSRSCAAPEVPRFSVLQRLPPFLGAGRPTLLWVLSCYESPISCRLSQCAPCPSYDRPLCSGGTPPAASSTYSSNAPVCVRVTRNAAPAWHRHAVRASRAVCCVTPRATNPHMRTSWTPACNRLRGGALLRTVSCLVAQRSPRFGPRLANFVLSIRASARSARMLCGAGRATPRSQTPANNRPIQFMAKLCMLANYRPIIGRFSAIATNSWPITGQIKANSRLVVLQHKNN